MKTELETFQGRREYYAARGYSDTEAAVASMLTENTGRHFLDSGEAYGRNWERNRGDGEHLADFRSEPDVVMDWKFGPYGVVSVFHFLTEELEYMPELDREFQDWANERDSAGWLEDMEEWPRVRWPDAGGIYGDASGPFTVNTYNGPDPLSQTLQFTYWTCEEEGAMVLMQVHGGCDVRGGYTTPRVFRVCGMDGTEVLDYGRYYVSAGSSPAIQVEHFAGMPERVPDNHGWSTVYDGETLHPEDDGGWLTYVGQDDNREPIRPLEEYEVVESEDETLRGVIRLDGEGRAFSPVNGQEMHAYTMRG